MKDRDASYLAHMSFVHWFLFGALDIPIVGRVALTGPNGAGKSSILDSIPTLWTGRSGRHMQLNSLVQVDRSVGKRTVRDYCLGAIDDAEDGVEFARQQAVTYLLHGFRRSVGGREVTIGICMSARVDQPDETVVARFIAEGRILTTTDVSRSGKDRDGSWTEALPWAEVQARLSAEPGLVLTTYPGPEIFVRSMCRILGPTSGSMDPAKFVRNLKNAIAFKPVGNTTDFVRAYILDSKPVNLRELRDSIARFKEITAKIAEIKARLAETADLVSRGDRIRARRRTLALHRLTAMQGRIHLAAFSRMKSDGEIQGTREALAAAEEAVAPLESELARLDTQLAEQRVDLAANDSSRRMERLDARAELLEVKVRALEDRLRPMETLMADAAIGAPLVAPFSAGTAKRLTPPRDGWEDPVRQALALKSGGIVRELEAAVEKAERLAASATAELDAASARLEEIGVSIRHGAAPGMALSAAPRQLAEALGAAGITSAPLCALTGEVDPVWHDAVEAVLGDAREALVVEPSAHERALKVFRSLDLHGAQVVNTVKTAGTRKARQGTLATAVKSDDAHARAFLDYRLGQIVMVHDEAGLAREETAITPDLVQSSGRTVRRLRRPNRRLLGSAGDAGRARDDEEAAGLQASVEAWTARRDNARSAARIIARLADGFGSLDPDVLGPAIGELEVVSREYADNRQESSLIEAEASGSDARRKLDATQARHAETAARLRKAVEKQATLAERVASREGAAETRKSEEAMLRAAAANLIASSAPLVGADDEAVARDWLSADVPPPPDPGRLHPEGETEIGGKPSDGTLAARLDYLEGYVITYHVERLERDRPGLVIRIGGYVNTYGIDRPAFLDDETSGADVRYEAALEWARREDARLEGQVLKEYESKAHEAYEEAVRHFQGDFAGRMRGAFEEIAGRLRELNRQLAKRDFHGLTYRFDKKPADAYKDMIALVESSGDPLSAAADGPAAERIARAMRVLEEVALDPAASIEDLEDPRRYFEFDIAMDKDGTQRTTMSKRMGTGSGGQVQVPYYVAICAALASTAFPDRTGMDGGIPVAPLDEAFNRMDARVIGEIMEFMDDVGLQPFIAAPDKERGTFLQFCDTMISMSRAGMAVEVDIQYVKPRTHERFREENPSLSERARPQSRGMEAAD